MKTKFDPLLLAGEQKVRMCEQAMARIDKEIREHQNQVLEFVHQMHQIKIPSNGNSLAFHRFYEAKRMYLDLIDQIQKKIAQLKLEKQKKSDEYKQCHLELEKFRFLQQKELQELVLKLKQKEQKELDEIAGMRFVNLQGER